MDVNVNTFVNDGIWLVRACALPQFRAMVSHALLMGCGAVQYIQESAKSATGATNYPFSPLLSRWLSFHVQHARATLLRSVPSVILPAAAGSAPSAAAAADAALPCSSSSDAQAADAAFQVGMWRVCFSN